MDSPAEWKSLQAEEEKHVMLRNLRLLCLIAAVLFLFASSLDYFAYPEHWPHFLYVRLGISTSVLTILALSLLHIGERHYRLLMCLVPAAPVIGIAYMIYHTGDPGSPYYAGLCSCLVAVGFLFQWTYVESIVAVVLTIIAYLAATIPLLSPLSSDSGEFGQFMNNGIFLLMTGIIIVVGSLVHQRIRVKEFTSRFQLAEKQKELQAVNRRLLEADRLKTDFFSNVTHELRTPLTLMLAPLQRLQRMYPASATPKGDGLSGEIAGIYQNGLRLLKLINSLLDLSRAGVQRAQIAKHRFHLYDFLTDIMQGIRTMAAQGGVSVSYEDEANLGVVAGDEEKLEKILLNLLFNAVKFTPSGGKIILSVRKGAEHIFFQVSDTGIGISDVSLPYVFDRFWQADTSVTRTHPGTGLGLALVKEFAGLLGGSVEAQSTLGEGTTMTVKLPLTVTDTGILIGKDSGVTDGTDEAVRPTTQVYPKMVAPTTTLKSLKGESEDQQASAAWIRAVYREAEGVQTAYELGSTPNLQTSPISQGGSTSSAPLAKILITDDEPGILRFMRTELEPNYQVDEAVDGKEALQKIQEDLPDLLIVDYMMANLDGLTLCKILRQHPETRTLPIMLVTARSDEEIKLTALRYGANDVLVKPFSVTEFNTRVRNLIENSRLQKVVESRNQELEKALQELRMAENELIQSEKMAALGILTGGIMHEINNPLNFTRSALYVLDRRTSRLSTETSHDIREIVTDLREGIDRISTIVSDLRNFCHPESVILSACPIDEPIQSALRLLAAPIRDAQVEVEVRIPPNFSVRGDKNQLTLVFLNLIKNAVDAIAEAATQAGGLSVRQITIIARQTGTHEALITVSDTGKGIPRDQLNKIFDPYFTTKPAGEGTGLGLSMCYRMISAHGGKITAEATDERGARFVIRLQLSQESHKPVPLIDSPANVALST